MEQVISAIIWILGMLVWVGIRIPHRRRSRNQKVVSDRRSVGERVALAFCIVGLVLLPIIWMITGWPSMANRSQPVVIILLGTAVMIAFLLMFYFSHKHLAKNWSVTLEVREHHTLIQHGLYQYVRHPMYTSFWLWGLAQCLLISNWVAGLSGILAIAYLYFTRIGNEEDMMKAQFGEEYDTYRKKTARLIPKIY